MGDVGKLLMIAGAMLIRLPILLIICAGIAVFRRGVRGRKPGGLALFGEGTRHFRNAGLDWGQWAESACGSRELRLFSIPFVIAT